MLKPKALYSLALLLLLNGCQTGKPRTPQETGEMPYGKWISFVNRPDKQWRRTEYNMDGKKC
ncbi:hypothetical protein ACMFME_03255 [Erwinia amylovora]|uniref:hypothetical protein n=1 Tax=Erwinia amylovora TaxID=552 RepID=UPI0039BD4707